MVEGIVGIAVIIYFLVLLFTALRIRDALTAGNQMNARILSLLEAVVPDSKKPKPNPMATKTCRNCKTINKISAVRCVHCNDKFGLETD